MLLHRCVFILCSALCCFFPHNSWALGLPEAVQYALDHSPVFDTLKKTKDQRELEYTNAFVKFFPSADFTAVHGFQNNIPIAQNPALLVRNPTAPYMSTLSLAITENLYDNGVSFNRLEVARLAKEMAEVAFTKGRNQLVLDVSEAYYRFSLSTILLDVRSQQLELLQKQFRTLSSQYTQGLRSKTDFLRIKTQVQRAEIDRIMALNSIELAKAELEKILGVGTTSDSPPIFEAVKVEREKAKTMRFPQAPPLLESIYDYKIATLQERANVKNVELVNRNYWPQVSLTSGVTYNNTDYINSSNSFPYNQNMSWNVLLTLKYNLWDWGTRRRDVEIAEVTRIIQKNSLSQGLLTVQAQVQSLMADLKRTEKSFKLTNDLLSVEEESFRSLEVQYRDGKVAFLDLITGLNNFLGSKTQFYTAYFEALTNMAKYRYFEGTIFETITHK